VILNVLTFQRKCRCHACEDGFAFDRKKRIFLVSDGISPDKRLKPSQAKIAADVFLKTALNALCRLPKSEKSFFPACRKGNQKIKELNQKLGFWDNCDYLNKDFAGAVFSGIIIRKKDFL